MKIGAKGRKGNEADLVDSKDNTVLGGWPRIGLCVDGNLLCSCCSSGEARGVHRAWLVVKKKCEWLGVKSASDVMGCIFIPVIMYHMMSTLITLPEPLSI
jgi:hypothetical protein